MADGGPWFISDHHLSHAKILTFRDKDDCLIRPEFDTVEEMNEAILTNHNEIVKPDDTVYFLGDVLWNKNDAWEKLKAFNGKIKLTPGNHDNIAELLSTGRFVDCKLWYKLEAGGKKFIAGHVPLAYGDMKRADYNIHGHIHEKVVRINGIPDPRYFNVCVEQLGYEPIHLDDIVALLA